MMPPLSNHHLLGVNMEWMFWISVAVNLALPIAVFFARNWLKTNIEKSVQHKFDVKIETLRTELRKNEESFKQELQAKEAEISTLRNTVIGGRANRQALLDKRRLEAVERVWAAFVARAPFYTVASMMSPIKVDQAAKRVSREENVRKFFEVISSNVDITKMEKIPAKKEQPFVSPLVWAYYSAYQATVMLSYTVAKALSTGIEVVFKLIKLDTINKMMKAALPHQSSFIDEHGFAAYYYLLDELEGNLLAALRLSLEGEELDQESVARSAEIIRMVKEATVRSEAGAMESVQ